MINTNYIENNIPQNNFQWQQPQIKPTKKSRAPFVLAVITFCLLAIPAIFIFFYNCYMLIYQNIGGANIAFVREAAGYVFIVAIIFLFLYTNWAIWIMLIPAIFLIISIIIAAKKSEKRISVWTMNIASIIMIITMLVFMILPSPNVSNMSSIVLNLITILGAESIITILLLAIFTMRNKKYSAQECPGILIVFAKIFFVITLFFAGITMTKFSHVLGGLIVAVSFAMAFLLLLLAAKEKYGILK